MKPALLLISTLLAISSFAQRIYGVEDTSNRRRVEYNLSKEAIKVFPNPAVNDLYITIRQPDLLVKSIMIYDKNGNRVIEQTIQSKIAAPMKLNVSQLKQGLYYLVLETNKQPYRMQLVKN